MLSGQLLNQRYPEPPAPEVGFPRCERERERVCVCLYVCVRVCVSVSVWP